MVLTALALSSCSGVVQGKPDPIVRYDTPDYPSVSAAELQCLPDDTYKRLNEGKTMARERVKTYENVIDKYNDSIK